MTCLLLCLLWIFKFQTLTCQNFWTFYFAPRLTLYECVVNICIQRWFLIRNWTTLFYTKYLASLTNQHARFYSIMRFYPVPVSQWYVYPRDMCIPVHISSSDMCIPPIWLPVKCVSPTPPPLQTSVGFTSVVFVNFANHHQRDYKWFKIRSNTIDKRETIRDKIIAKLSLASLLLRGSQCWCKHSFSLLSLSNVIIIHMSLVALNKYDCQNFIQQGITRKVKK